MAAIPPIYGNRGRNQVGYTTGAVNLGGTVSNDDSVLNSDATYGVAPKLVTPIVSGVANFLAGSTGVFTLTGNAAGITLKWHSAGATGTFTETAGTDGTWLRHWLAGATGTFVETGNPSAFSLGHHLAGATGAFTETAGADGTWLRHWLTGVAGAFSETSGAAGFKLVPAGVANKLAGATGSFLLTGSSALFKSAAAKGGATSGGRKRKRRKPATIGEYRARQLEELAASKQVEHTPGYSGTSISNLNRHLLASKEAADNDDEEALIHILSNL